MNTDSSSLIGTDTFVDNEVRLRKGPVYQCAENGGFGVFDEINMAKNDAVSVLHATLDYRRLIDVPGYDKIELHSATRFIGTMNYGYAGTRELNEALVSRFLVIDMPPLTEETLMLILRANFPDAKEEGLCGSVSGSADQGSEQRDFHEAAGSPRHDWSPEDRALRPHAPEGDYHGNYQ